MQIRTKLAYQFSLIVAAILVLFASSIYYLQSNYRIQEFRSRLKDEAFTVAKLLIQVDEVSPEVLKIVNKNSVNVLYKEQVVVYDSLQNVIYYSNDDEDYKVPLSILNEIRIKKEVGFTLNEKEAVGILFTHKGKEYVAVASSYDRFGLSKLKNLRLILISGLFVAVCMTILMGLFFAGQALKPITSIIAQINATNISNISNRLNEGNKTDEIAQLAIQFNKMLDRLQSAFEIQKNFVSNASHELRTPLTLMTNQIEVGLMKERESDEYKEVLRNLLEEVKNLTSLSNGLLDLAQSSMDLSLLSIAEVRIDELLLQIQTNWNSKRPNDKILIVFDEMQENDNLSIQGNENLIKTVFINLIDNGIKFSRNNTIRIKISFKTNSICIEFIDNGIGINDVDLIHVFEPFYRASNASAIRGHGIGLSLCRKIIQLHNGKITIESKLHVGTKVFVQLPYSLNLTL